MHSSHWTRHDTRTTKSVKKKSTTASLRLRFDSNLNRFCTSQGVREGGASLRLLFPNEPQPLGVRVPFVASADVVRHDVEEPLVQKGGRPGAVRSLRRESCDLKGRTSLPSAPISPDFLYARGARQECGRT